MKSSKIKVLAIIVAGIFSIYITKVYLSISQKRRKPVTPILKPFVIPPIQVELSTSPDLSNSTKTIFININTEKEITNVVWSAKLYDTPEELFATSTISTVYNAEKISNTQWSFEVFENGTYTVAVQDENSNKGVASIFVSNFDRLPPPMITDFKGACDGKSLSLSWKNPNNNENFFTTEIFDSPFDHIELSYYDSNEKKTLSSTEVPLSNPPVVLARDCESYVLPKINSKSDFYNITITVFDEIGNNQSDEFRVYLNKNKKPNICDVVMQDETPIAVIAGYRNGIPLGLGLNQSSTDLQWTSGIDNGYNTMFETTICTPMKNGNVAFYSKVDNELYFQGDINGSDNWSEVCKSEEIESQNPEENYPAFSFALHYGEIFAVGDHYKDNWFLPSVAEIAEVYKNKEKINIVLEQLEKQPIQECYYWTSSQYYSLFNNPVTFDFSEGFASFYTKYGSYSVLVLREF